MATLNIARQQARKQGINITDKKKYPDIELVTTL